MIVKRTVAKVEGGPLLESDILTTPMHSKQGHKVGGKIWRIDLIG